MKKTFERPSITKIESALPQVMVLGRPNVGKSTLFNRLVGRRKSIVHKERGTTRDFVRSAVSVNGKDFEVIDTGGFEFGSREAVQQEIEKHVENLLKKADLILWVVDVETGITPLDERFAVKLRPLKEKVLLIANKADSGAKDLHSAEFYRFGFDRIYSVSALHGHGSDNLLDMIASAVKSARAAERDVYFSLAIAGEPNSGKSTYMNKILGEYRSIVSDIPGTTRDMVEEDILYEGKIIRLVDTAGMRQRKKIREPLDLFSLARTHEAVKAADVILLLFDAYRGFGQNSKNIAQLVEEERKACVLVANKWDLIGGDKKDYEKRFRNANRFLGDYPIEFMSALEGKGVFNPLNTAVDVYEKFSAQIATKDLNRFVEKMALRNPPPPTVRFKYAVQTGTKPPVFTIFSKNKFRIPPDYVQHITNEFVREFKLDGVPVQVRFRDSVGKKKEGG